MRIRGGSAGVHAHRRSVVSLAPQRSVTPGPRRLAGFAADRCLLHVVGAHGGSGESTVAAWLDAVASGHRWPTPPHELDDAWPTRPDGGPAPVPVVLAARTSAAGLSAAQSALREWGSGSLGGVDLLALVLLADAPGRLPRPLADYAAVVAGAAPDTVRVGWSEPVRMGDPAGLVPPRALRLRFPATAPDREDRP